MSQENCVFCRIVAKQIPASIVHEDEHTLAFMDLGQVNPGQTAGEVVAPGPRRGRYQVALAQQGKHLRSGHFR